MRKIIAYVATSADGYIAQPDGGVAWLNRPRPPGDYGMGAFYRSVDTVVMGRKTYDLAHAFGQESYPGKKNYVFSRTRRRSAVPNVEFVRGKVGAFAQRLRDAVGKNVWLVGGAELIGAFADEGQIDEFIIHVIPTLIGDGIPLLHPRQRSIPLAPRSARSYPDGVVRLHYAVLSPESVGTTGRKAGSRKRD